MKKTFYIFALAALAAAALSCDKWTTPKALDYNPKAPSRDASYVESMLDFKGKKTHKVTIAVIDGMADAPTRVNQHPGQYPDSLDYLGIKATAPLYPSLIEEFASLKECGVKILHEVDYALAYDSWFETHLELETGFLDHLKTYTKNQLDAADAYSYDGIIFSYTGKNTSDLEAQAQNQFISDVKAWIAANPGKEVIFRGYTRNLIDPSFLKECEYIIIVPGANSSVGSLDIAVNAQIVSGMPKDRFVMEVAIPDALDGEQIGPDAQQAVAWLQGYTSGISKKGIAFANAQEDYFNPSGTFDQIRTGIKLSN